ncbi:hypothetical protein HDK77DRAFT_428931 [Phyllosticta capitalensis]
MSTYILEQQRKENARLVTVLMDVSSTLHQSLNHQGQPAVVTKGQMEELARLSKEVDEVTAARKSVGREIRNAIRDKKIGARTPPPPLPPFWERFDSAGEFLAFLVFAFIMCGIGLAALILAYLLIHAFLARVYDWLILPAWLLLRRMSMTAGVFKQAKRYTYDGLQATQHIAFLA